MIQKRIKVQVEPGMFPSERAVSFEAGGRQYTLLVDAASLTGDTLTVYVVAERDQDSIVDLPRETFTSGSRVRIPSSLLMPV